MNEQDAARALAKLANENEKLRREKQELAEALQRIREKVIAMEEEVEKLSRPPLTIGVFLRAHEDGTADVSVLSRKFRVEVGSNVDRTRLRRGAQVLLNEMSAIVGVFDVDTVGRSGVVKEVLRDGRVILRAEGDEEIVLLVVEGVTGLRAGDVVRFDPVAGLVLEQLPREEIREVFLEETPTVTYEDIGGLKHQIEQIRDAVELPFLHEELFREYRLEPPKGVLLYGPPGCGKTMLAKAVANSLACKLREKMGDEDAKAHFLSIKGPELLNKWVGETERQIRVIFQRAREKAASGDPVIVFFDEMDSIFRTRGSGISSDVENTIVPQLLSEIDGVESLKNVIVIGASNREDLIDPAILRPGRLDVKIKIERPNQEAAEDIMAHYLTPHVPIHPEAVRTLGGGDIEKAVRTMIEETVRTMYEPSEENKFLEVTYQNGERETLYFKDFNSGAMIENIVRRAKKEAIKRFLATDGNEKGIKKEDLLRAISAEFKENQDLPNTTNPDDWARISGKKGQRIAYVRTLFNKEKEDGGREITTVRGEGQYL